MWLTFVGFTGPPDFHALAVALRNAAAQVEMLDPSLRPSKICRCAGCGEITLQATTVDGYPLCWNDAYPGAD